MKIQLLSLREGAEKATGTVVIIDVFRAFTVQAVAFSHGVEKILLTDEVAQAIEWREAGLGDFVMGEDRGIKPDAFDFHNRPRPFLAREQSWQGKTLIHRSSSGTRGVCWASPTADRIYAASLWAAEATVQTILRENPAVVSIVAMGLGGAARADEDELCAYYLRSRLEGRQPDIEAVKSVIRSGNTYHCYENTVDEDYPGDAEIALQFDSCDFAISVDWEDDILVSRPVKLDSPK